GEDEEEDGDGGHIVQLDCTVEEGEDIFDITFDRTKCEKTYTMKYKVKKEPVGKCDHCSKQFYSEECLKLHELEHEKFLDIANIEPSINIIRSPRIEESTMTLDDSFYEALDVSDILEHSSGTIDCTGDGRLATGTGIMLEYQIIPRRSVSGEKEMPQVKDQQLSTRQVERVQELERSEDTRIVNQPECQPEEMVVVKQERDVIIKEEPIDEEPQQPSPMAAIMQEVKAEVKVEAGTDKPFQGGGWLQTGQKHVCSWCSKRFRFRVELVAHERNHLGISASYRNRFHP
uniref:C2H2-type domain-containing protein n=1 Tax=Anopheles maculatus TaxID=74869 RepID=A0A182SBC9_9DIPT